MCLVDRRWGGNVLRRHVVRGSLPTADARILLRFGAPWPIIAAR
jgi:hypothetical protein